MRKALRRMLQKPAGQWNPVKLHKQNGHLTLWLNSVKNSRKPKWQRRMEKYVIENSKFKHGKLFIAYSKGYIVLRSWICCFF